MRGAYLTEAIFQSANFVGVDLEHSVFEDANLENANFRGANLRASIFTGTHLAGVDLSDADLRDVDFSETDGVPLALRGAVINSMSKLPAKWPQALRSQVRLKNDPTPSQQCRPEQRKKEVRDLLLSQ
jgi:uncharacterized protein YjbI with pentapeptide repeats